MLSESYEKPIEPVVFRAITVCLSHLRQAGLRGFFMGRLNDPTKQGSIDA
jgi:hypothetical protein